MSELMTGIFWLFCAGTGLLFALWAAYQIGYQIGHQRGWRAGAARGLDWSRLKELEKNEGLDRNGRTP